jgi:hypothetical protein
MTTGNWLDRVPASLREQAIDALEAGDGPGFLRFASNEYGLELVMRNMAALKQYNCYETALLDALISTRTNNHGFSSAALRLLVDSADRNKLREAGDRLPGTGPFTVYRGVAGRGPARHIRGLSWTGSLDTACWYAHRFKNLADPVVYQAVVDKEHVLAYSHQGETGRGEDEYIILLPPSVKVQRIMNASETSRRAEAKTREIAEEQELRATSYLLAGVSKPP